MAPVLPNRSHRQLHKAVSIETGDIIRQDNTLTSYPIQNGHVWFRKGSKEVIKPISDRQLGKIRMMGHLIHTRAERTRQLPDEWCRSPRSQ